VQLNGETSHIVIKNLTAKYFHNDGYNVHGRVKDAVFLNCLESKGTAWHTVLR
jgi:hypothetical protein